MFLSLFRVRRCFWVLAVLVSLNAAATAPKWSISKTEQQRAFALFKEFLSYPNDASQPEQMQSLIDWLKPQLTKRKFMVEEIETQGLPLLVASRQSQQAEKTLLVYLQLDGQPVDPTRWQQESPFQATLKAQGDDQVWNIIEWQQLAQQWDPDWRIFARSASDSKGPMTQFLMAIDSLDSRNIQLKYNLKVVIDTEEELGSPHLAAAVKQHKAQLAADALLIFDGPPHASSKPTVSFGARGIATLTLTAYGPKVPQHSGHYGNYVPNPAFILARALSSLKDPQGRVEVAGFYDGIELNSKLKTQLARVPDNESEIQRNIGFAKPDAVAESLQLALQYPSLNIRGLRSGWVGKEVRTIIPDTATAEIDIRLVVESDPQKLITAITTHLEERGFSLIDQAPTEAQRQKLSNILTLTSKVSYSAFRSEFDSPPGLMARKGLIDLYGKEPILIRTMGGSIPISPFVETLGIPAAIVPTVNMDNNQHSPNENIRIGNFIEGISMLMAVLNQPLPGDD